MKPERFPWVVETDTSCSRAQSDLCRCGAAGNKSRSVICGRSVDKLQPQIERSRTTSYALAAAAVAKVSTSC